MAVTQRVEVVTVEPARADGSGGSLAREPPQAKTLKGGTKVSVCAGKGTLTKAGGVKTFRDPAKVQTPALG